MFNIKKISFIISIITIIPFFLFIKKLVWIFLIFVILYNITFFCIKKYIYKKNNGVIIPYTKTRRILFYKDKVNNRLLYYPQYRLLYTWFCFYNVDKSLKEHKIYFTDILSASEYLNKK